MNTPARRYFTYQEAAAVLPKVQEITAEAFRISEEIHSQLATVTDDERHAELQKEHNCLLHAWAKEIQLLGVEVKGLWTVDFDSGDGIYYCWNWPEPTLEYFHHYDSGFAARRPLGSLKTT